MAKYEVLIKAVTIQGLSYAETARRYGGDVRVGATGPTGTTMVVSLPVEVPR